MKIRRDLVRGLLESRRTTRPTSRALHAASAALETRVYDELSSESVDARRVNELVEVVAWLNQQATLASAEEERHARKREHARRSRAHAEQAQEAARKRAAERQTVIHVDGVSVYRTPKGDTRSE